MCPDKFPEAFKRYEKKGTVGERNIETFEELLASFVMWGDKKATLSKKQTKALAVEAKREGLKNIKIQEMIIKDGRTRNVYRDPITGKFAPKGETAVTRNKGKAETIIETKDVRIEKYANNVTKYRDPKTGKFTHKPKG